MTQKIEKRQCIEKATQEAFTVVNKKETETRKKQVKRKEYHNQQRLMFCSCLKIVLKKFLLTLKKAFN